MDKIQYVERVLGFRFSDGFARHFEEVGSPQGDLDVWYKNAQVYEAVTGSRTLQAQDRISLTVLIEAIRFDAAHPPVPGDDYDFDLSAYEFSEDVLAFKADAIEVVLRQEASSPSVFDA